MKAILALAVALMLSGCGYHPLPVTVYATNGAAYTAPDLCAALTKCLTTSGQPECYYNSTVEEAVGPDGAIDRELATCKAVKR